MNGYVIMYSNGKYLIINNPNEKFFMKMDVHDRITLTNNTF